jgi:hypothetical protein
MQKTAGAAGSEVARVRSVKLELVPVADPAAVEAMRRAVAAAGIGRAGEERLWWRAGIEEALASRAVTPPGGSATGYVAARSPRRTRGATRA